MSNILDLVAEMVSPDEIFLEAMVEDELESEEDAIMYSSDIDDDVIEFIERGDSISVGKPLDTMISDIIDEELENREEEDLNESTVFFIDNIEDKYTYE